MRANARACYRALARAIAGRVDGTRAPSARDSFAARAVETLRARVGEIVRRELARARARDGDGGASETSRGSEVVARCAVATAFFREAWSAWDSGAAAHARASAGYADGARRRNRRVKTREPSRRERRIEEVRKIVVWGCDEGPFGEERARAIGMSEGLTPRT